MSTMSLWTEEETSDEDRTSSMVSRQVDLGRHCSDPCPHMLMSS